MLPNFGDARIQTTERQAYLSRTRAELDLVVDFLVSRPAPSAPAIAERLGMQEVACSLSSKLHQSHRLSLLAELELATVAISMPLGGIFSTGDTLSGRLGLSGMSNVFIPEGSGVGRAVIRPSVACWSLGR